ncbi:FeoA family protein [Paramaledivibacter caminithermalis]|jgi:ferrous iron transport protein A|uniref:Ferrous iron transport protein A n=1 Tax=Paramaledivibacter caminithermalis (strain DSM 15212 / CIP 107654 / DViRD3) TaxID=1121301 RepID=A0A1M6KIB0_PARC5|nr:FeoA family protein [Paramaledivibacter caminithermalis]SHJ58678.1 ferrous iron transport protein A [Paramaledivibacter caminithermalis DSM 15212]
MLLSNAKIGSKVKVISLQSTGLLRRRMLDLGLIPGTQIEVIRQSPLGDPIAYGIKGAQIALRKEEAKHIKVDSME